MFSSRVVFVPRRCLPLRIHVLWYICLHENHKNQPFMLVYQSHGSYGCVQPKSWKCTSYQLEQYMKVCFNESIRIFQPFDGPPPKKKNKCAMVQSRYIGDGHPTFNRNPYNGYINPHYWVDDHPLICGNNGSLDPGTSGSLKGLHVPVLDCCAGSHQNTTAKIQGNSSVYSGHHCHSQ